MKVSCAKGGAFAILFPTLTLWHRFNDVRLDVGIGERNKQRKTRERLKDIDMT